MILRRLVLALYFMVLISSISSEVRTGQAMISGTLEMPMDVDAIVKTKVTFYPENTDWEKKETLPFPYHGVWTFIWDSSSPENVEFEGSLEFGNYFTITDAGDLGGTTKQTFYNFKHIISGIAEWDDNKKSLNYKLLPEQRDDGQASIVKQDKDALCEKIKGLGANRACKAFNECSLELEGFILNLIFDDNLGKAEGDLQILQYGGSGMTKSSSKTISKDFIAEIRIE